MDANKFKGSWHQFKGELKHKWGQLTDDDLLECEGSYEKFLGVVQKRYGDKIDEVQQWADDWYSEHEQEEIRGGRQLPRVIKRDFLRRWHTSRKVAFISGAVRSPATMSR